MAGPASVRSGIVERRFTPAVGTAALVARNAALRPAVQTFGLDVLQEAQTVTAGTDVVERTLDMAGVPVRWRLTPALAERLLPALNVHDQTDREPVLDLLALDDTTVGTPPAPPWRRGDYHPGDGVSGVTDDSRIQAAYNLSFGMLSVYDRERAMGVFWTRDEAWLPQWELSHPLRILLHWGMREHNRVSVHGAPIGVGGRGALLVGGAMSGKSTTAFAALERGFAVGGDDYCVLEPGERAIAHALFGIGKLRPGALGWLPGPVARAIDLDLAVPTGDTVVPMPLTRRIPIDAVVLPHVGTTTRLTPITPSAALRAVGPKTAFHIPSGRAALVGAQARIVRELPAYDLELGGDPYAAVELLRGLLEDGC